MVLKANVRLPKAVSRMKKLYVVAKAVLGLVFVVSLTGCVSTQTAVEFSSDAPRASAHFHDDSQVNAVLQFSSWDYTFLLRPQYTDNGFLQQVRPENINQVLDRLNVRRGTAAVLVGWTYNGATLDKVIADWKTILGQCGFQRVVILRAQDGNRLNGSVVIDDSILHLSSTQGASQGG